jgi:hypothetical protein
MPSRALTDLIVVLLHEVIGPRRRRHGGWRHRHTAVAPASPPPPPSPSAMPHHRVLERTLSPSPDRPVYRPMVLSNLDAHPRGRQGGSCAIHGWDCLHQSMTLHYRAVRGRRMEEKKKTTSATSWWSPALLGCRRYVRRCTFPLVHGVDPKDCWYHELPPTSLTPSLAVPGPPPALPSSEVGPSGSGTPSDHKSPCGNRFLRQFAHHAAPSGKDRTLRLWDSMVQPSR